METNMVNNYQSYMQHFGPILNQEIKNNIRFKYNNLILYQLVEYIMDTVKNYDYRNCPEYNPDDGNIGPEPLDIKILISEEGKIIVSNSGDAIISALSEISSAEEALRIFVDEIDENEILKDGDSSRYEFDKSFLMECLTKIMNEPVCLM